MSFIEKKTSGARACSMLASAAVLAGCSVKAPAPSPTPAPPTQRPPVASPTPAPTAVTRARHWDEYRVLAAKRMVAANPSSTYMGVPPEPLLAIPVLEIELQADGQVARITVQRHPSQARDTVQLAIDAVKRSAPFGPVAHLPKPWKFSEVFLFDDNRRFKPRTLD